MRTVASQTNTLTHIQNKVLQEDLIRRKAMCDGYEKQLHRVQEQMVAEMDDKERDMDRLRAEMDKCKVCMGVSVCFY